jgi:hypothetical protein
MARFRDERRFLTAALINQSMALVAAISIMEAGLVASGHRVLVTRLLDEEEALWYNGDRGPLL